MSFVIKNIQMTLDPKSIEEALEQVERIRSRIKPAMQKLIESLAEKGVGIARSELIYFDPPAYWTGALWESVKYTKDGDGNATITAGEGCYARHGTSYAMYVEFGTGSVGQGSAINQDAKDTGTYTQGGWVYFNEETGTFLYTEGMAARPFMYHTYLDLIEEAEAAGGRIVAEYLAD